MVPSSSRFILLPYSINSDSDALTPQFWVSLLSLVRLFVLCRHRLAQFRRPTLHHVIPPIYATLKTHLLPWIFVYPFLAFFDFRSSLLANNNNLTELARETCVLSLAWLMLLFEVFTPRLSISSPSSSPPSGPSLFSLAFFTYLDPLLLRSISSTTPSDDSVPPLSPRLRTAPALHLYRQSQAQNSWTWGLAAGILWAFRKDVLVQQGWGCVRLAVFVLPSLLLKGFLKSLDQKQEEGKLGEQLLFVGGIFLFQQVVSVAEAQSQLAGRRLGVQFRCVFRILLYIVRGNALVETREDELFLIQSLTVYLGP